MFSKRNDTSLITMQRRNAAPVASGRIVGVDHGGRGEIIATNRPPVYTTPPMPTFRR